MIIHQITNGKHPGNIGLGGGVLDRNIPGLVGVDHIPEQLGAWIMPDGHKHGGHIQDGGFPGLGVAELQPGDGALTQDFLHHLIGGEPDFIIGPGALQHDCRRPEPLPAVHNGHGFGELGEENSLLHGGVAAPNHRNIVVPEEEPIAGGAGGNPMP